MGPAGGTILSMMLVILIVLAAFPMVAYFLFVLYKVVLDFGGPVQPEGRGIPAEADDLPQPAPPPASPSSATAPPLAPAARDDEDDAIIVIGDE